MTIVFNGGRTLRPCVRNALKSVDQIIIVEGVVQHVAHLSNAGHSTDGTVQVIEDLCREFGDRVVPVIGQTEFWLSKLDMCNEALLRMEPGSWLVEFDADEFYFPGRLNEMMEFLESSNYTCAEVWGRQYYGDLKHHAPIIEGIWGNNPPWRRMFKYDGIPWRSHTPPRLPTRKHEIVMNREVSCRMFGVEMHHASYCWREQAVFKAEYFGDPMILRHWDFYKETGAFDPSPNAPIYYDGPRPFTESDFE